MTTDDKLSRLLEDVAALKADVVTIKGAVKSLEKHILHGNGVPSILSRLAKLETAAASKAAFFASGIAFVSAVAAVASAVF